MQHKSLEKGRGALVAVDSPEFLESFLISVQIASLVAVTEEQQDKLGTKEILPGLWGHAVVIFLYPFLYKLWN